MTEESQDTRTIELPIGLTRDGTTHRELVLRKPTVEDWINLSKDAEVRQLGLNFGHLELGNTLGGIIAQGPIYQLYTVLMGMLVVRLGSLEQVSRKDFRDLQPFELDLIMPFMNKWLGLVESSPGEKSVPFDSSNSSEGAQASSGSGQQ